MENRRFLNRLHPQTLQTAALLMYINAAFMLLSPGFLGAGLLALYWIATVAGAGAAYLLAQDKKIGYQLALAVAFIPLVVLAIELFSGGTIGFNMIITVLFKVALAALLLHPMSKNYAETWFK